MRFIIGILGVILGFLIVIYREPIKRFTGNIAWAERRFGPGGSYTAILLFGFLIIFMSFLYASGTLQIFFENTFGRFFPK